MSSRAYLERPGHLTPGASASVARADRPIHALDQTQPANLCVPGFGWAEVRAMNFLAPNTYRLTGYARLILNTHVPDGPTPVWGLDACLPALRLAALRCIGCAGNRGWPCPHVEWACDWIECLPQVMEAIEPRGDFVDGVSTPVAVGDMEIPAATWDTPSRGREVG